MDRDPATEALIVAYATEAREICDRLTRRVLELEQADLEPATRAKRYEEVARGLHTLKGNSDTFGFRDLADLAHRLEDIVIPLRAQQQALPPETADALLRALDVFTSRLSADDTLTSLPPLDAIHRELAELRAPPAAAAAPAPRVTVPPPFAAPQRAEPEDEDTEQDGWRVGTRHVVALMADIEKLREIRLRLDEQRRAVARALRTVARITSGDTDEARIVLAGMSHQLASDADETGSLIESLEQQVKAIATQPLATILDPLRRAVRDLCRALGKEARLSVVGAEMSLDRRILDALKGPLVQLVRNAVDHGLETPDERMKRGKHREGAIVIRAEQHGNLLVLEIDDDGNGLDVDKIRAQALALGLVTADEAGELSPRDLFQLVFRPGFSTAAEVSEVSGRGIGLDVVRSRLQALAGTIEIHSTPRQGTRFVLTVPADLGSTAVLVVGCDDHELGVPMLAIETLRAITANDLRTGRSNVRLEHNGQLLPLYDLGAVMGLRPAATPAAGKPVLIVGARGRRVAISVDELVGDRDLVVRPLPVEIKELPAYIGAATLAHGELLLVLAPEFLTQTRAAEAPTLLAKRVLVVDDSLTARALHRTILESGAYAVDTVGSARQALEHLRHAWYDAVVADVRMAGMDGFDLVAELRTRDDLRELPVILVSAHDSEADRARGLAAGADVFLSKKECISGRLLSEVGAMISRKERS